MRGSLRLNVVRRCVGRYFDEGGGELVGAAFRCLTASRSPSANAAAGEGWAQEVRYSFWQCQLRGYGKSTKKDAKMYVRNEDITAPELRVVLEDGTHKIMTRGEALKLVMTGEKLDLVLITADSVPPVAKVMNFNKYKHGRQQTEKKIASATRVRVKLSAPKEVRVRPRISDHDLQQKLKKISEFLGKGFKVTVAVLFKGEQEQKMAAEALHFIVKMVEGNNSVEVLTAPENASRRNSTAALISPVPVKDAADPQQQNSSTPQDNNLAPPPPPPPPADPSSMGDSQMKAD